MTGNWKQALIHTYPIALGYYPVGIAYGVLMTVAGLPLWLSIMMSIIVYSGAAQYAAIPLLSSGAGIFSLSLNTFIINLRHMFYALPLLGELPQSKLQRIYCLHALTDESFSVLSTLNAENRALLFSKIVALNQFYWVSATILGALLGSELNHLIPNLDFALCCLFVVLWYEQYLSKKILWSSILAIAVYLLAKLVLPDFSLIIAVGLMAIFIVIEARFPISQKTATSDHKLSIISGCLVIIAILLFIFNYQVNPTNNQFKHGEILSTPWLILAVFSMGLITFALRAAPSLIPQKWLQSDILKSLNFALPLSVMTILILASLSIDQYFAYSNKRLFAEIIALVLTWAIYRFKRNVLLAMITGVLAINLLTLIF